MRGLSELPGRAHTQFILCFHSYKCLLFLRLGKKKERESLIIVTFNPRGS